MTLESDHLVGRSPRCTLRIDDGRVSGEHAVLRWSGESWLLRDLGSTNGTRVDDRPLTPGESLPLREGARITFGHPAHLWILVRDDAPAPMAVPRDGGDAICALDGLLALPSADHPLLTVHRDGAGGWRAEGEGMAEQLGDQSWLEIDGRAYRLCLPEVPARTAPLDGLSGRRVADLSLTFHASLDLEHIEIELSSGSTSERLGPRGHHEILLVLARARSRDRAAGLPSESCGWMYQDELCRAVRLAPERLNVDVYRIRRQLAALRVLDPAGIIERRTKSRQLRIGIAALHENVLRG